jgi:benzoyl-CoA reductase/2-hydroxyglutaryl-CoA dehydratase subunit BcrC/BadD/HgdB
MYVDIEKQLINLKQDGRKILGCFPLYPPLELFYAMDITPVVLWGLRGAVKNTARSDRHLQPYACAIARHLTEFVLSGHSRLFDGLFMYNACDTLRNLPEIIEAGLAEHNLSLPLVRVHIPMVLPAQTDASGYFKNEIQRLITEMERLFDVRFSRDKFVRAVETVRCLRNLIREAEKSVTEGNLSFLKFSRALHKCGFSTLEDQIRILEDLSAGIPDGPASLSGKKTRPGVILSGILPPPTSVITAIEASGLRVVGNDIASLGRSYASMPEIREDPGAYFLDFYYQHFPCPTLLYTGDRRATSLMNLVEKTGAAGVIFMGEKFCEYEYFEFPFLAEKLKEKGIKTLEIEIAAEDDEQTSAHDARIGAFAELLKDGEQTIIRI